MTVREVIGVFDELKKLLGKKIYIRILDFMDGEEFSVSLRTVRIADDLSCARHVLCRRNEDIAPSINHLHFWARPKFDDDFCDDDYGEVFIPLPDGRFLTFEFYS